MTQTLDQQEHALEAAGVTKTFSVNMSGARDDRPGLAELMAYVRERDTVVVWKLDRLGRNTLHILETVRRLADRGMTLVSVTDGIDSSTAAGRMVIGVLASMAEFERELVKERTALKRASSRANGTKFGRPRKVEDIDYIATATRMKSQGHTGKARRQVPRGEPGDVISLPRRRRRRMSGDGRALNTMIERTRARLIAAAADGREGGRPRKMDDADAVKARSLRDKGVNATDIAQMLNVSRATVYRYLSDSVWLPD